jgi:hypothetical protein
MGALIFLTGINFALEKIGVKTGLLQWKKQ